MEQKQYILIFSTAYLPFIGGAELAIKDITDRIHDFTFILITARLRHDLPQREHVGNVEIFRVGIGVPLVDKLLSPFLASWCVYRIARREHIKLFWSVMVSYTTITPVLLKMFGLYKNTPLLLTLQEGDSEKHIFEGRFGLIAYWWRAAFRYASHVQVISVYLEKLARSFGYAGPVSIVPNGVETKKLETRNLKLETQAKHKKIIITVSRLVEKNGVDILIRAFAGVHKKFPLAELHIVGDGYLRVRLEALTRALGMGSFITFFGEVPHERVSKYYTGAYIFVRPSRSEGLGIAFLEAMAAGLPIIGTPVGGIVDFLKDGETGLFSNVDDPHDLASKIELLLSNPELYKKLQDNGCRLVKESYDWNTIAERMTIIFKNLCAS